MKKNKVPGLAFGIVIDGELAFAKGFGVRDTKSNAPVDADSVFRIASMTKSFTALAILQLRDAGRLALDDPAEQQVLFLGLRIHGDVAPALEDRSHFGHEVWIDLEEHRGDGRRRERRRSPAGVGREVFEPRLAPAEGGAGALVVLLAQS